MDEDDIQQDNALEIGVVNPEAVIINDDDGGVVIDFRPSSEEESVPFDANLAEYMDEGELSLLSSDLIAAYDEDRASRGEWEDAYIEGLDLLGVKIEDRTTPFEGATGVTHPILSEAVIRFVSQAMMEIFPSNGPVRTTVIGKKTLERDEQARRVQDYMNYLLTEEIEEYRPSTEQLLFKTALAGSGFRKVYYDRQHNRPDSIFVPAEDFVVSYDTTDIKSSPRYTHVMRKSDNFVRRMQLNGFYRDIEIGSSSDEGTDIQTKYNELTGVTEVSESDVRTLLEMHVELDLPGFEHTGDDGEPTGLNMPYVVTIDHSSDTILSIRRNYQEADPLAEPFQHFVHYKFQPGLGFYGFGLIHLIGSIARSSTSILRQLIDAGTLANLPAGFKARGLRIKGDDRPIEPGEFRDIDLPGGAIRDNILPLPFKEPSPTLAQLMGVLVEEGRRIASIADLQIGEGNQEAPVGTTIALIERSMKVMSAVHARLHASLRREFKLLSNIIKDSLPEYPYEVGEDPLIARSDFDDRVDIIPVSDPNATSFAQRIMQQQAALQTSAQAPQLYDLRKLHRSFLQTVGVDGVDEIVPDPTDVPAFDPISENARIMAGAAVKVFAYQDHDSHISAHMSLMQDPSLQQNPMGKMIAQAISAHISEHMAHKYRNDAQDLLTEELPPLNREAEAGLTEEEESRIAAQAAQAAAQITGKAQQQAVLEQQMAAAQDPVVQQQQAELQVKQAKIQQDAAEAQLDAQVEMQKATMRTQLERERLQQQKQIAAAKIEADLIKNSR
tara:strand:- start:102 stop:2444 length:2343 start_codon:yes stop_codon:yes gene_type:complete